MKAAKTVETIDLEAEKQRTRLFDADDWLQTILAHPELEEICPWELFGEDRFFFGLAPENTNPWREILLLYPEMIRHAPVPFPAEFLDACDWAKILLLHPELKTKVPWNDLKWRGDKEIRGAWMKLLVCRPEFAKYCHWGMFYEHIGENNPNEWIKLLQLRPEFITYYLKLQREQDDDSGITLICTRAWAWIVAIRPELLPYAPKRHFTKEDWKEIIQKQPQIRQKKFR